MNVRVRSRTLTLVLSAIWFVLGCTSLVLAQRGESTLPKDVYPDSRNRLPVLKPGVQGVAAVRLHGSGVDVRWQSPLGRQLTELAILTTAREHDQPYEWSLHEMEALAVGLDPAVIDVVRHRRPVARLTDKQAIIIEIGREIFGRHALASDTYARALRILGKTDLVDVVSLMANYAATATRLTAFNQQMPPGWKQFLPLPFAPPDDIHPDSRSRLPLIRRQAPAAALPPLYSRGIAPEGTGPGQIRLHGAGGNSLEARVGKPLISLAGLVTAREHGQQYHWTMNERAALDAGLEPATIDRVRHGRPIIGLGDREAAIVQFGRELFGKHTVSSETYARALKTFGETDLVDLVDVMAQHASDATLLTAFDQRLPSGQEPND